MIAASRFRTWPIDCTAELHPELKELGLELPADAIDGTRPGAPATALSNALVSVGAGGRGGTGSFLGAEGLIITNHHVALDAIRRAARRDGVDYLENGFVASDRAKEAPCDGYECWITRSVEDCSAEVLKRVTASDPLARANALRDAALAVAAEKEASLNDESLRCDATATRPGRTYALTVHERLRDVRLVYAPPKSLASFGGDEDNFEWPRHSADFALLRAYAGAAPYAPAAYLRAAPAGAADGDAVFLLGFPGFTMRYAPSSRLRFTRDVAAPSLVKELREKLACIAEHVPADQRLRTAAARAGLANEAKRSAGKCAMLRRVGLVEEREKEEALLKERVPAAAPVLAGLGEVYAALGAAARRGEGLDRLRGARHGSALLEVAFALYDAAIEQAKPEDQREAYLRARHRPTLAARLARRLDDLCPPHEAALVLDALRASNWNRLYPAPAPLPAHLKAPLPPTDGTIGAPGDQMLPPRPTEASRKAASLLPMNPASIPNWPLQGIETLEAARKLVDGSPLRKLDKDQLEDLLSNPYDQSKDLLLHPITGAVEACYNTFQKHRDEQRGLLAKRDDLCAQLERLQGDAATRHPDCNGSLRFSIGRVEGYRPADAVTHGPRTTLRGLDEKRLTAVLEKDDEAAQAFAPPARLVRLLEETPAALRTPVNVLYSTDTLGGNSGSPVLDAKGRFVAINFDRPRHGLVNEFCYDPEFSRSVGVDVRYVLWLVGAYDGATGIVEEILRET